MTIKITNVRHKDGKTRVCFDDVKGGDSIKSELESDITPVPEFLASISDLGVFMADLMNFPESWKKDAKCLSVAVGHEEKDERINAIVTMRVKLEKFNNGITVNSPVLREKVTGLPGGGAFMAPRMLELVKTVMSQGQKYIDGERAQQNLLPRAERGSKKAGGPAKDMGEPKTLN